MTQIQGYPGLYKNSSGVIVNKSSAERHAYRQMKEQALKQVESQYEIQSLKDEVKELKDLIHQLIQNNGTEFST